MVSLPFQDLFLVLLAGYTLYSAWAGENPHGPIYGALLVLAAAILAAWTGLADVANSLALDVVFLLMAGVALIAFDRRWPRKGSLRRTPPSDPPGAETAEQHHPATQHPLHDLEGEGVAVIDAAREEHDRDERTGDPEPQQG